MVVVVKGEQVFEAGAARVVPVLGALLAVPLCIGIREPGCCAGRCADAP
jgi:hypothetical protein